MTTYILMEYMTNTREKLEIKIDLISKVVVI